MRLLGIDPGIERTGFAILEVSHGEPKLLDAGCIRTSKEHTKTERLHTIAQDLSAIIRQWKPTAAGVEIVFFSKNVKTAITVSHARGVILEVLERHRVAVHEFNPSHIKMAVTGNGRADKLQIQRMLQYLLNVEVKSDDTADAIACSLCLMNSLNNLTHAA